jgi:DnaJ-domain-containing protein 1
VQSSTTLLVFDPKQWLNDPVLADKVGRSMSHALKLLGLRLGASAIEVKVRYRQLAREYHPDKNNQEVTGLTTTEASDLFKPLNNANMFLQGQM